MTAHLPSSPAPVGAIQALVHGLTPESGHLARLAKALESISRQALENKTYIRSIGPLRTLLALSERQPESVTSELLLSCITAYPLHRRAISKLLSRTLSPDRIEEFRGEVLPSLVTRLQLCRSEDDTTRVIRILLLIVRAHDELLGLVLEEATFLLPAIRTSYQALASKSKTGNDGLQGKTDALIICHELISAVHGQGESKDALKRLMGGPEEGSSKAGLLGSSSLKADYEGLLERGVMLDDTLRIRLDGTRDEQAALDPRVTIVQNLFPHLSAHTILAALSHTYFTPHPPTLDPEAAAAPLIDALLSGQDTIPDDLVELKRAMASHQEHSPTAAPLTAETSSANASRPYERRNIWDEQKMDLSRLKIADDFSDLPGMGDTIPDHLRDSIMRLVESQAEEEAEQEKALREAHGFVGLTIALNAEDDDDEGSEGRDKLKIADGEDSGEEESGDKVVPRKANGQTYDVDQQTKLEVAYLSSPNVFDRDSQTRRSDARKKLKELTKMDDAQLEGWRIMLDRNPHKEAILSRHTFAPAKDYLGSAPKGRNGGGQAIGNAEGRGGGRGNGRGGARGGGGRGGDKSDQGSTAGSSRGGGGGGGRGRGQNKSSRGHSNAARTRGHDKKMARMGAGA